MFRLFGRHRGRSYTSVDGHRVRELTPIEMKPDISFVKLPEQDIPILAEHYIAAMETGVSDDWCRCLWYCHPDDANIDKGNCRECNQPMKSDVHKMIDEIDVDRHHFRGIRKRKVDESADCPVHTRVGLITHFFEWVFTGDITPKPMHDLKYLHVFHNRTGEVLECAKECPAYVPETSP